MLRQPQPWVSFPLIPLEDYLKVEVWSLTSHSTSKVIEENASSTLPHKGFKLTTPDIAVYNQIPNMLTRRPYKEIVLIKKRLIWEAIALLVHTKTLWLCLPQNSIAGALIRGRIRRLSLLGYFALMVLEQANSVRDYLCHHVKLSCNNMVTDKITLNLNVKPWKVFNSMMTGPHFYRLHLVGNI